jgi:hypothetical protein
VEALPALPAAADRFVDPQTCRTIRLLAVSGSQGLNNESQFEESRFELAWRPFLRDPTLNPLFSLLSSLLAEP